MQHAATHYNALQHTAMHCNTLQHTASHCNMLQYAVICCYIDNSLLRHGASGSSRRLPCFFLSHWAILQHTATYCNILQHTATHCNTQHAAIHGNTQQHTATHCNTLQHTATRGNTLQHTLNTLQHTLQHAATHCNTLQHTATQAIHYYDTAQVEDADVFFGSSCFLAQVHDTETVEPDSYIRRKAVEAVDTRKSHGTQTTLRPHSLEFESCEW